MKEYFTSIFKRNPMEIQGFNGIRGIAYYMVIYAHFYRPYRHHGFDNPNTFMENFLNNGSLCMDAFFVLSGFLIGGQLIQESFKSGSIDYKKFFIKRVFRIFPPYYIFIFLQLFIMLQLMKLTEDPSIHKQANEFLSNVKWDLLYMTDYFPGTILHGWSLSVEEKFYLILPLLLFGSFFIKNKNINLLVLFALFLTPGLIRLMQYMYFLPENVSFDYYVHTFYYPFHSRMDSLFLGVFFAGVHVYYPELIKKYLASKISIIVTVAGILSLFSIMLFTNEDHPDFFTIVLRFTIASLAWSTLMLKCLDENSLISKFFSLRAFIPVAKLSYCGYIIHMMILGFLTYQLFGDNRISYATILIWTVPIGTIILFFGYIYYLLTEKPFMLIRSFLLKSIKPKS
jgi:peptidoglycan/LPS O-acetylase OafA/YrhL